MNVYRNTPLEHFTKTHGLSVRALNVCRANGIHTLGKLLSYTPEMLQGLRNCGTKSATELEALRRRYQSVPEDLFSDVLRRGLRKSFDRACKRLDSATLAVIDEALGFFGEDHDATSRFVEAPYAFIDHIIENDSAHRGVILRSLADLFRIWKEEESGHSENMALVDANLEYVMRVKARFYAEDIFATLPLSVRRLLERRYHDAFHHLSVRTVNALNHLSTLDAALPYIFGNKPLDSHKLKNAGARTLLEMHNFLEEKRKELLAIFTSFKKQGAEWEAQVSKMFEHDIAGRFPFLTKGEVSHIATEECSGRSVSPLYLLERYIQHSSSRSARIYALRYGIGEAKKHHCAEIGKILGLTGERVRQLAVSKLLLPEALETALEGAFEWFDGNVISEDDAHWAEELAHASLSMPVSQLMAMSTALRPDYMPVQLCPTAKTWLVRRELLTGVNLMTSLRLLNQTIEMKRTRREVFAVSPYIFLGRPRDEFHPDVLDLVPIYKECLGGRPGVTSLEGDKFAVGPNKLDVIAAVEDLLEPYGHSVSYAELCRAFDEAYPGHLSDTERQLRSYIFRSKKIASVGRSGRYVMRHWENAFSGTVAQCMAMELEKAGEPLTANELHSRVARFFPSTSLNSINVFAYLDKGRTIVMLPDRRYASAGKGFEGTPIRNKRYIPFDRRMEALGNFVSEHRRFPLLSDEGQESLRRWLDNVRQGVVVLPNDQRAILDDFLRRNRSLPMTSGQKTFREHVHSVMRHVCRYGALPTPTTGRGDYDWLQRIKQNKRPYGDLRDHDLGRLCSFLINFGYSI